MYIPPQCYDKVFNLSEYIPALENGRLISQAIDLSSPYAHFERLFSKLFYPWQWKLTFSECFSSKFFFFFF